MEILWRWIKIKEKGKTNKGKIHINEKVHF